MHPFWDARVSYGGLECSVRDVFRDHLARFGRRDGWSLANRWMSGYDLTHHYRTCVDCGVAFSVGAEHRCSKCDAAYEIPTGDVLAV